MTTTSTTRTTPAILIVGASRGLGRAMAAEFLTKGWDVTGTVRDPTVRTGLHDLADEHAGRVAIEVLDITEPDRIAALRERLDGRTFDVLFVNAGTTNDERTTVGEVTTEEFVRVMVTNALSPMRVVEALGDLVEPLGTIAVMSSGQGSVANNQNGGHEVYRGSKAALNTFMRSYAARQAGTGQGDSRTLLLMAPGWVSTDLGGPDARLSVDDSIPRVVETIDGLRHRPGLHYVDYLGRTVPW